MPPPRPESENPTGNASPARDDLEPGLDRGLHLPSRLPKVLVVDINGYFPVDGNPETGSSGTRRQTGMTERGER